MTLRLPIKSIEDIDGNFVAFRQHFYKTGEYRHSAAVQIVVVDNVEYMQLPSYLVKINKKFTAELDGGKLDVERAVMERRLYFLNESGEIVAAHFDGDKLVQGARPEVNAGTPKKIGIRISGIYQYDSASAEETKCFVKTIFTVCATFGVKPNVRVFTGVTTKVRIRAECFKSRSSAMKAMQEIRILMPYESNGKRQMMKLYE